MTAGPGRGDAAPIHEEPPAVVPTPSQSKGTEWARRSILDLDVVAGASVEDVQSRTAEEDVVADPAQRVEVDRLHVVEVHRHGGHVAGEADPPADGRDDDVLVDVAAVEEQSIEAGLALDGIAAVARVPDERVIAGPQERHVVVAA